MANERATIKTTGERMVYIKGTRAARDKALELIRSNPKVSIFIEYFNYKTAVVAVVLGDFVSALMSHAGVVASAASSTLSTLQSRLNEASAILIVQAYPSADRWLSGYPCCCFLHLFFVALAALFVIRLSYAL